MKSTITNPLVTVIFITYNQDRFLNKAVNSIISQTYDNLEIILCNNGSTDNTKLLLREYEKYKNIRIVNFDNGKKYTIVQAKLVDESNGEYICFIGGDDYYLPNFVETNLIEFSNLDDSFGIVHSPDDAEYEGSSSRRTKLICSNYSKICNSVVKLNLLKQNIAILKLFEKKIFESHKERYDYFKKDYSEIYTKYLKENNLNKINYFNLFDEHIYARLYNSGYLNIINLTNCEIYIDSIKRNI